MQASIRWSHSTLASRLRPIAVQHNQPAISHSSSMQQQACQDISPLWQQVVAVYDKAQEIGAATKTETKVQECEDNGIRFVLRVASALKSKPKGLSGSKDQSTSGEGEGTACPAIVSWPAVVSPSQAVTAHGDCHQPVTTACCAADSEQRDGAGELSGVPP